MLFQKNIVKKYVATLADEAVEAAWKQFAGYFLVPEIQQNIRQSKEEQFQEGFLRELFVKVLGYTLNPSPGYNLITEQKNETNAKKADGAILLGDKVIGVIELKDHKTTDLSKIEAQAFGYKSQHKGTRLVIISNFEKLRLYIDDSVEYREWDLFHMTANDFRELYVCLAWMQVERGIALQMKQESVSSEDQITKALYKDYSQFKRVLFEDIVKNNRPTPDPSRQGGEASGLEDDSSAQPLPSITGGVLERSSVPLGRAGGGSEWQLLLFKKTQKLLDRFLFIFFAEDCGLLTPNSMVQILDKWQQLKDLDAYVPLYDRVKQYFGYLDKGHEGKPFDVFAYNGGLYRTDEVLDSLVISDDVLLEHTRRLASYDFESDVDVNILGHIFENSLSEIEEVTRQIEASAAPLPSREGLGVGLKRKQDGVFYTPQYITKYIVENTVGRLCAKKKQELGIVEEEYNSEQRRQLQTRKRLMEQLQTYREWLLQITILDPACGSGAFLNAALRFLLDEHKLINEMEAKITDSAIEYQYFENAILENNLFGVDINEESVEIAQLALWLRTAKPHRKLNSLNQNIKCGNSLISDPAIAGDKAFDWQKEFPQVFQKGGFDVVIGNPPYVEAAESDKDYYRKNYSAVEGHIDLFELFIQKGIDLLKDKGQFAFINPNTVLSNLYSQKLRKKMVYEYGLREVINFGMDVFQDPTVHTCIIIMNKGVQYPEIKVKQKIKSAEDIDLPFDYSVPVEDIENNSNFSFDLTLNASERAIFKKLQGLSTLGDFCYLRQCIKTGNDKEYVTQSREAMSAPWKKTLRGKGMSRYSISEDDVYLKYGTWLARNWNNITFYECDKIAVRETGDRINACLDTEHRYFLSSLYSVYPKESYDITTLKTLLAILNSRFATFYIQKIAFDLTEGAFTKVRTNQLARLPLPNISGKDETLSALATTMLTLHSQLQSKRSRFLHRLTENLDGVKITSALQTFDQMDFKGFISELKKQKITLSLSQQDEWEDYFNQYATACRELKAQIAATDAEIDAKVFDLYGLTEEERKTVMGV